VQQISAGGLDFALEPGGIVPQRQARDGALDANVEFHLRDHADGAIAADRGAEELGPRPAIGLDDFAVRQHQLQRLHGMPEGPVADITAMGVDRHRAADGEVGVAVHGPHRQLMRVDEILQIAPAHARLHAHRLRLGAQPHQPVHFAHVEVQAAGDRHLPAH